MDAFSRAASDRKAHQLKLKTKNHGRVHYASPEQEDARYKAAQRMAELIEEREALMARADDDPDAAIKLREVESEMRAAEEVVRAID